MGQPSLVIEKPNAAVKVEAPVAASVEAHPIAGQNVPPPAPGDSGGWSDGNAGNGAAAAPQVGSAKEVPSATAVPPGPVPNLVADAFGESDLTKKPPLKDFSAHEYTTDFDKV